MYLEDGGEWRDPDSGADEDGVLGAEDVGGGRAEGAVHVHLQRLLQSHLLPGTILNLKLNQLNTEAKLHCDKRKRTSSKSRSLRRSDFCR